jgi:hypothetical protein
LFKIENLAIYQNRDLFIAKSKKKGDQMRVNDCIEKTKKTVYEGLVVALNTILDQNVPRKIVLDAVVELYINVIAAENNHKVIEIFKSMDSAEQYLKAYCDDYREANGMLDDDDCGEDNDCGEDDDGENEWRINNVKI